MRRRNLQRVHTEMRNVKKGDLQGKEGEMREKDEEMRPTKCACRDEGHEALRLIC